MHVQVSVAKAGLVASLPARTSILAAANPVEGHFNRSKTVSENLKMSPAMLSRWAPHASGRGGERQRCTGEPRHALQVGHASVVSSWSAMSPSAAQ